MEMLELATDLKGCRDALDRCKAICDETSRLWDADVQARDATISRLRAELATTAEEFRRAVDALVTLRAELTELRKPDCHRCRRYHRYGFGEGVCANTLIGEPACINGDGFREADPVRLYEKEGKV